MTPRRIGTLLLAGALAVAAAPAFAQGATDAISKRDAAPKKPRAARKPAKPAAKAAAARSPILGGEDEAASLERRRKAFFAKQPDEGTPDQPATPSAGVTLGGSGGITPGMGFKF